MNERGIREDERYSFIKEHKEKLDSKSTKQMKEGMSSSIWESVLDSE